MQTNKKKFYYAKEDLNELDLSRIILPNNGQD